MIAAMGPTIENDEVGADDDAHAGQPVSQQDQTATMNAELGRHG
jgi:hypothetical protein